MGAAAAKHTKPVFIVDKQVVPFSCATEIDDFEAVDFTEVPPADPAFLPSSGELPFAILRQDAEVLLVGPVKWVIDNDVRDTISIFIEWFE